MDTSRNREVIASIKRGWNEDAFMRAQGLSVQEHAPGEVTICLAQAAPSQRGGGAGGDAAKVINGGVISYMCDGALGYSIISGLLALPDAQTVDARELRTFTITLTMTIGVPVVGERVARAMRGQLERQIDAQLAAAAAGLGAG